MCILIVQLLIWKKWIREHTLIKFTLRYFGYTKLVWWYNLCLWAKFLKAAGKKIFDNSWGTMSSIFQWFNRSHRNKELQKFIASWTIYQLKHWIFMLQATRLIKINWVTFKLTILDKSIVLDSATCSLNDLMQQSAAEMLFLPNKQDILGGFMLYSEPIMIVWLLGFWRSCVIQVRLPLISVDIIYSN